MVYICTTCNQNPPCCQKKPPQECRNKKNCQCRCNVNGKHDVLQKSAVILGGLAWIGCGIAVCATGGLAAIVIGRAVLGAGMSSTVHGTTKAIKGERIDPKSYAMDVGVGAVTGVLTGGIGAVGEVAATAAVKQIGTQALKAGATKLAVRATTGAVSGVVSKGIDEARNGGNDSSLRSYATSAFVGAIGGAGSHVSSNVTKAVPSGVTKSAARVVVSGGTAAACDATIQRINIASGNQDKYDFKRTVTSAATSAMTTAAQEGIKNGIYRANGGKDKLLHEKTNKKLHEDKNEVPEKYRKDVNDGYDNLKKIPEEALNQNMEKARAYNDDSIRHEVRVDLAKEINREIYDPQIQEKTQQLKSDFEPEVKARIQQNLNQLKQDRQELNKMYTPPKKPDTFMNEDNAHFLTGVKKGQVAFDVKTSGVEERGTIRAIYDYDPKAPKDAQLKFAGFTDDHNYSKVPNFGEGPYDKTHATFLADLKRTNNVNNFTCNQIAQNQQQQNKKKKGEKKE